MSDVDELLHGACDMHLHPSPFFLPSIGALEAAKQAMDAGMRAIVLKNHSYPTPPLAALVSQLVPDVAVIGSVCLEYQIGGLNPYAVGTVGDAKVVWMPTLSSANSIATMKKKGSGANPEPEGQRPSISSESDSKGPLVLLDENGVPLEDIIWDGYSILDENGALLPEVYEILSIIKERNMVLATGHISPREIFILFDETKKVGIEKLVVTHGSNSRVVHEALSLEEQIKLADMGAFIEHTALQILPSHFGNDPAEIAKIIKAIGAQRCIMSTDMGPIPSGTPVEGMMMFISALLSNGVTPEEIELMLKVNPAKLLDLD